MNCFFKICGRLKLTFRMTLNSLATSMEFQVIILFKALEEFDFLFKVAGTSMKVTCKLELPAGAACCGSGLLLLKSVRARLPFSASVKTSAAADGAGTRTLGAARSLWAIPPASTRRPD